MSILILKIFDWNNEFLNIIGSEYIIMEYVEGV